MAEVRKLRDRDMDSILIVAQALQRQHGISTPAEEFLRVIISDIPHGLNPYDIQHALNEFEENFALMRDGAVYLNRFYPKLAEEAAAEASEVQNHAS